MLLGPSYKVIFCHCPGKPENPVLLSSRDTEGGAAISSLSITFRDCFVVALLAMTIVTKSLRRLPFFRVDCTEYLLFHSSYFSDYLYAFHLLPWQRPARQTVLLQRWRQSLLPSIISPVPLPSRAI